MGDWANVVTESAKIVSASAPYSASTGVGNALSATYAALWVAPYTSKESMFSMPMTITNSPGGQNYLSWYYNPSSSESYFLTATSPVYVAMAATDVRKTSMTLVSAKYYLTKYPDYTNGADYAPVIRYSEVLLSRAEALVKSGSAVTQGVG